MKLCTWFMIGFFVVQGTHVLSLENFAVEQGGSGTVLSGEALIRHKKADVKDCRAGLRTASQLNKAFLVVMFGKLLHNFVHIDPSQKQYRKLLESRLQKTSVAKYVFYTCCRAMSWSTRVLRDVALAGGLAGLFLDSEHDFTIDSREQDFAITAVTNMYSGGAALGAEVIADGFDKFAKSFLTEHVQETDFES